MLEQGLHDTTDAVKLRVKEIKAAGADIVSVHAAGTIKMMVGAVECGPQNIYAITLLTSIEAAMSKELFGKLPPEVVMLLTHWAAAAQVAGVVCSAQEVGMLATRPDFRSLDFVVPGTRSAGKETHDQVRVDTPKNAMMNGATYLVIGRQITQSSDPLGEIARIEEEIEQGLEEKEGK